MTTKKNKPAEKPAAVPKDAAIKALNEIPTAAEDAKPDFYDIQATTAEPWRAAAASPVADTAEDAKPDLYDRYLVVIPYFAAGAQGRELEYCIEGWRRHFNEPYHIVVVGDRHPVVDSGADITFIDCPRVEVDDTQYTPHRDFVNKLRKVRAAFPDSDGFIFCADDVYAVNNFDIADVRFLKAQGDGIRFDNNATGACFETEKRKTKAALEADGYPTRNYTTHLPQWLEWGKLEALWDRYDMANESYIFEDLYFNIYCADRIPFRLNLDHDNLKCGIYRSNPRWEYVRNAFRDKIWIQNSVDGWTHTLEQMLQDYYQI